MDKIKHLKFSLVAAAGNAQRFKNVKDEGTCNFDTPIIFLKDFTKNEIEEAFLYTPFSPYFNSDGSVDLLEFCDGQGFRRTAMAEAVRDSLKSNGYEAYVRYNID